MSELRRVRAATATIDEARRRLQSLHGRVEALAGGSSTGIDHTVAAAIATAEHELLQALEALQAIARDD